MLKWYVYASYMTHEYFMGHTGEISTIGIGSMEIIKHRVKHQELN